MSDEAEDPTCSRCGIVLLEHEIADGHCADRSAVACRLRAKRRADAGMTIITGRIAGTDSVGYIDLSTTVEK